ncbi:MAG: S8/S53 family peptidase [Bergeyella sp.]
MKKFFIYFAFVFSISLSAQTELVFVFFRDKPNKAAFYSNPLSELSQKSLDRRTNLGIPLNDQDAPIEASYIAGIEALGFTVTDKSKWLNGVAVNATSAQITQLAALSFVQSVESFVKNPSGGIISPNERKSKFPNQSTEKTNFDYGTANSQIEQINLKLLHQAGFTGSGITIAMLDTGYPTVNTGNAYKRLRDNGKIKGGYNFISKNNDLYNSSFNSHGAICLGATGGYLEGQFTGSAPDADYYLFVTEHGDLEIPEEELYWIQAAEEADRLGVDVISASLGYGDFFDDTRYNYTYQDMTGSRSFVARGAQAAAEKGIFVLAANGNEAYSDWNYLLTPADNEKVFSVGAVTASNQSSSFSSFGPNYLGVIKPDASARGTSTATVYNNSTTYASGTSLSTPLAAGGVASFLGAVSPTMSREAVKNLLRSKSSLYPNYTDQMGYGILNFWDAYSYYLAANEISGSQNITLYPNPNSGQFTIESDSEGTFTIYDFSGKLIYSGKLAKGENPVTLKAPAGTYQVSVQAGNKKSSRKLVVR